MSEGLTAGGGDQAANVAVQVGAISVLMQNQAKTLERLETVIKENRQEQRNEAKEYRGEVMEVLRRHDERISKLEEINDRQAGAFNFGRWLIALPASLLGGAAGWMARHW